SIIKSHLLNVAHSSLTVKITVSMGTSCLPFILGSYWKKGIGNKSINDLSLRGTRSFPKLNFLKTRLVSIGHFLSKTQMISWWSLNVLQIQMKFLKVDLVVFSL